MKIAVFASGSGSNFQSIATAIQNAKLSAQIVGVFSNKKDAGVFARAVAFQIPCVHIRPNDVATIIAHLEALNVNTIVLAGYLRKIPDELIAKFPNRILNIHPSLLPAFGGHGFYGAKVHQAVLESGVRWTGVTIHFVDAEYDTGAIILQEPVPVRQDDNVETLAARVLKKEHQLYPQALQLLASGKIQIKDRKVILLDKTPRGYP